jgi:hypothetical protein
MSDKDFAERPAPSASDSDVWSRFMAAALMAAPHAPADKLATTADEALVEYRRRRASGGLLAEDSDVSRDTEAATPQPFVGHVEGDSVGYEIPATTPLPDASESPLSPPVE